MDPANRSVTLFPAEYAEYNRESHYFRSRRKAQTRNGADNPKFKIQNFKSPIQNPQSQTSNPESPIQNLKLFDSVPILSPANRRYTNISPKLELIGIF